MSAQRANDVVLSLVLLLVCMPTFVLAGACIWFEGGEAPVIRKERVTRDGRVVRVFRLRTTRATQFGRRLTRTGAVLRHAHIDVIPQLLNVLNGDFSLAGPRPAFIDEIGGRKVFALREP